MRKKFPCSVPIFLLIFILILTFQFYREDRSCIERTWISWTDGSDFRQTSLYENNGIYYCFLPSYADISALSVVSDTGYTVWLDHTLWQDTVLKTNHQYDLSIKNPWGLPVCNVPFVLMQSANIPSLSIDLHNSSMADIEQNKEGSGHMTLIDADSNTIYDGELEAFHIRGNHTATLPKKPYALKFSQNVDLLGSGAYSSYCLIANAEDESRLRNKLVYETAQELGLPYSPESEFVDLYVDDMYYGLYLLTDKIGVHENRIPLTPLQEKTQALNFFNLKQYAPWSSYDSGNLRRGLDIPADPVDITGGYLLELEVSYRLDENTNAFISDSGQIVSIKYPAQCSSRQVNYIADFYQSIEDSIPQDTYTDYIDLESWANYYLVQEFFGQYDKASIFFYKDSDSIDPKLYAGPVWDFDWSFGLTESYTRELHANPYMLHFDNKGPFLLLCQQESFRSAVRTIYETTFYPVVSSFLPEAFDYYEQQIQASHSMDKCRWDNVFIPKHGPYTGSLHSSLSEMKDWISHRINCFNEVILQNQPFLRLSFYEEESADTTFSVYSIAPNSYYSPTRKVPVRDGYLFAGWYDLNGEPLTADRLLTKDIAFYARWEPDPGSGHADSSDLNDQTIFSDFDLSALLNCFVLFFLAAIGLFVLLRITLDHVSSIKKRKAKGHSHDKRTKVAP